MTTLCDNNVDIAAICETWLQDSKSPTTAIIKSYGFSIRHSFRKEQKGGGTALIFKSGLKLSPCSLSGNYKSFESTAAFLKSSTGTKTIFLVIYRTGPISVAFVQELDTLLSILFQKCDCLILSGDLNIHFEQTNINLYQQTLNILHSYGLQRQVFKPTHIGGGCLDHVFIYSVKGQLQNSVTVESNPLFGSDHIPVYCTFTMAYETKYLKEIQFRNTKQIDKTEFSIQLQNLATECMSNDRTFKETVATLFSGTHKLLDEHAPIMTKTISIVEKSPWFDGEYKKCRIARRKAERIWKKSRSASDYISYKKLSVCCTQLADKKKKEDFSKMIAKAQGNPKTLYQFVNKELDRSQTKMLPEHTNISELTTKFNNFFVDKVNKIRENMSTTFTPQFEQLPQMKTMHEFRPSCLDEIKEIISECGVKCSPSDLLPQGLLKENMPSLLPVFVHLVNLSLSSGNIDGVKSADIAPALKSDSLDPDIFNFFRPISNLLFLGKLTERVVLRRLEEHLSNNGLNCPEQSAYKKGYSTETLLIRIWNDLLVASDNQECTIVMMLDLSAAFDTVDHDLLLNILKEEIGLRGKVLSWFTSFITGRS